eukprot:229185_1
MEINLTARILYTFPRIYIPASEWTEKYYNQTNTILYYDLLKSAKNYLNKNGEIHLLLMKQHFENWKVNESLKKLGLKLSYWCTLNQNILKAHFYPYEPRDANGKPLESKKYFHIGLSDTYLLCSFIIAS